MKILLLESEPQLRHTLAEALKKEHWVDQAVSLEDAEILLNFMPHYHCLIFAETVFQDDKLEFGNALKLLLNLSNMKEPPIIIVLANNDVTGLRCVRRNPSNPKETQDELMKLLYTISNQH